MKQDMKKIREALGIVSTFACKEERVLLDAIDEPEALRAKEADLSDAIVKWRAEASALSRETGGPLTEIRRAFGPGVNSAWSMGAFTGPCAHGRDPYTRCDTCGELEPREALIAALKVNP